MRKNVKMGTVSCESLSLVKIAANLMDLGKMKISSVMSSPVIPLGTLS